MSILQKMISKAIAKHNGFADLLKIYNYISKRSYELKGIINFELLFFLSIFLYAIGITERSDSLKNLINTTLLKELDSENSLFIQLEDQRWTLSKRNSFYDENFSIPEPTKKNKRLTRRSARLMGTDEKSLKKFEDLEEEEEDEEEEEEEKQIKKKEEKLEEMDENEENEKDEEEDGESSEEKSSNKKNKRSQKKKRGKKLDSKKSNKEPPALTQLQVLMAEAIHKRGGSATFLEMHKHVHQFWGTLRRRNGSKYTADAKRAIKASLANNPASYPIFVKLQKRNGERLWGNAERGIQALKQAGKYNEKEEIKIKTAKLENEEKIESKIFP